MTEKRFRKVMGFIQDNTCEGGDVEGVMDLTEIKDMLNELYKENEQLEQKIKDKNTYQRVLEAKIRRLKNRIKILEKAEGWQN